MSFALEARTPLRSFELDVELTAPGAHCLAIVGPSGAGKTTILRIAAGLMRPAAGRVSAAGEVWLDTARGLELPAESRQCGMLFQGYALFPHMTALQNVAYPLTDLPRHERGRRALSLLERFGMAGLATARPAELSGGERQRVALARALARGPSVLLLDEPLSALDPHTRTAVAAELRGTLSETGVPTLLVTHEFSEAAAIGDEVAVVDAGRVIQLGTPAEVAARPAAGFVASLVGAVVLTGTAHPAADGLTAVELDGGGTILSSDLVHGRVSASVYPWEIELHRPHGEHHGSARNELVGTVASRWTIGGRVRVGIDAAQPLVAEVTEASIVRLGLEVGSPVRATWKAVATRLLPRS